MIACLRRTGKITEAFGLCLCRFAPNRSSILPYGNFLLLLMQAARRASRPRRFVPKNVATLQTA
jgi:hypothetical protein